MNIITIPKNLMKEKELVIIPRREYENLLMTQETERKLKTVKRSVSFRVPKKHKKFYEKIDKKLTECLKNYKKGNLIGPFSSIEEMKQSLEK